MTSRRLVYVVLLVLLSPALAARQLQEHQWLVTVMDDDHNPVTGLGSEDFSLKDGGARQPVVASAPATGPLTVALITVGVGPETQRDADGALERAVAATGPGSHVAVVPADRSARVSFAALVTRATETLAAEGTDRRAIVALIGVPLADPGLASDVVGRLQETRTPLWTVEVHGAGGGNPGTDLLNAATAIGGGWRWPVDAASGLTAGAEHVGALLGTGQYLVTANVPLLLNGPLPLATRHDRGIVLVPMWSR